MIAGLVRKTVLSFLFIEFLYPQVVLYQLDQHPYYRPSLETKSDLLKMVDETHDDIVRGFKIAGIDEILDDFFYQIDKVEILKVLQNQYAEIDWMFYRSNGEGPVKLVYDLTWVGSDPIKTFKFKIDSKGLRYTFIVPLICGNIALRGITKIPPNDTNIIELNGVSTDQTNKLTDNSLKTITNTNKSTTIQKTDNKAVGDKSSVSIIYADNNNDLDKKTTGKNKLVSIGSTEVQDTESVNIGSTTDEQFVITENTSDPGQMDNNASDSDQIDKYNAKPYLLSNTLDEPDSLNAEDIQNTAVDDTNYSKVKIESTRDLTNQETVTQRTEQIEPSKESACNRSGWSFGFQMGTPLVSVPNENRLNFGIIVSTPLAVNMGLLNVGISTGIITDNFNDYYYGGGLILRLCMNDMVNLNIPLVFQAHGIGAFNFGKKPGPAYGVLMSAMLPINNSSFAVGIYGAFGSYYSSAKSSKLGNMGLLINYSL